MKKFLRAVQACPEAIHLLANYASPAKEVSLAKGIPLYNETFTLLRRLNKHIKIKIRYRGPRQKVNGRMTAAGQSTCLERDATSLAVYLRRTGDEHDIYG